jgi:hypothetical protein
LTDLIFIVTVVAFFAVCVGVVVALDRIIRRTAQTPGPSEETSP